MKTIGYLRVSTDKQENFNQESTILKYANEHDMGKIEFCSEVISSRKTERAIYTLIDTLSNGDNLIIFELSRLARSMSELRTILSDIQKKGATIYCISQNLIIKPQGNDVQVEALIFALSISSQIERDMISSRTKNALAVRAAKGLPMGRPAGQSKLNDKKDLIMGYQSKGLNLTAISKLIDCNRQTLANWLAAQE